MSIEGHVDRHWTYSVRTEAGVRLVARGSDDASRITVAIEPAEGRLGSAVEVERHEIIAWMEQVVAACPGEVLPGSRPSAVLAVEAKAT